MVTTLIDDQGNPLKLKRNSVTKVFAGFYSQEVNGLDDPRGAVISKTYFINIANSSQTVLQLVARITGNRSRMVRQSENPSYTTADLINGSTILPATYAWLDNSAANQSNSRATYRSDDADYNTIRKYDLTPILLTNPSVTSTTRYGQTVSIAPYQSTQNRNQFIYSRYSDVSNDGSFYSYINPDSDYTFNLDTIENFNSTTFSGAGTPATEFIWGGGFLADGSPTTATSYPNGADELEVSIAHPWVQSFAAYQAAYQLLTGDTLTLATGALTPPTIAINCTGTGNGTAAVLFRQSKFTPLKIDDPTGYGKEQAIYLNENLTDLRQLGLNFPTTFDTGQTLQASPSMTTAALAPLWDAASGGYVNFSRNAKNSFDTFDQYTLGEKSCGSYLFISTDSHENIQVDGDSIQSYELVQFGQQNSLNIPLVFQYRMTDYFGVTTGSGLGNVAGDATGATVNLTYAKRIGFDIYPNNSDAIQFDIELFAKYRSDRLSIDVFPKATVTRGLNDLEKVVAGLRPSITQTSVSQASNQGLSNSVNLGANS